LSSFNGGGKGSCILFGSQTSNKPYHAAITSVAYAQVVLSFEFVITFGKKLLVVMMSLVTVQSMVLQARISFITEKLPFPLAVMLLVDMTLSFVWDCCDEMFLPKNKAHSKTDT
jgi:hypothetical protein